MRQFLLAFAIGSAALGMAVLTSLYGGQLVSSAQVGASDLLMVRVDGPRLGARPARSDIVLVLFDHQSATALGSVHSYTKDLELYRRLVAAQAAVVFDTRMIAADTAEAFVEVEPLLEGMLTVEASGRLMRDAWLAPALQAEHGARYSPLLAQNIINTHPHQYPSVTARLYPLAYLDMTGFHESAPLAICRKFWNEPSATPSEVGEELGRCGVISKWHELPPGLAPPTVKQRSDYTIGAHRLAWHPFLASSMLVSPAAFWVGYDPAMSGFERLSYVEAIEPTRPLDLKGKIVMVGFSADIDPSSDTYIVPNVAGKAAAAEVVACATQTLLDERNMRELPMVFAVALAAVLIIGTALLSGLVTPLRAVAGALAALLCYYALAVLAYRSGWYADFLISPAVAVLAGIPAGAANAWRTLRARQRIVDLFGRYVPRAVVSELLQSSDLKHWALGGTRREVTVLFADIRGFTSYSCDLPPEEVVQQLNSLLEIMVACTFENQGTLDKFIGDAVLVLFNAPLDQPDHTERAVRTAISIQRRLAGHPSGLRVGIGVHRGAAVVGNIGTPQRMEYTAIGSTVNIASRLCDLSQAGQVIVSSNVLENLPATYRSHSIGAVNVKGIKTALEVSSIDLVGELKSP